MDIQEFMEKANKGLEFLTITKSVPFRNDWEGFQIGDRVKVFHFNLKNPEISDYKSGYVVEGLNTTEHSLEPIFEDGEWREENGFLVSPPYKEFLVHCKILIKNQEGESFWISSRYVRKDS